MSASHGWITGRAWVFPEPNLNTDVMMPLSGRVVPKRDRALLTFSANRPGWAEQVKDGDILVAGRNFGTGSSRPAAEVFRDLGIRALVAESINGLFFRNCINYALPPLECPGILDVITEGDIVALNLADGQIVNHRTGVELRGTAIPAALMEIVAAGGLLNQLKARGFL